MTRDPEHARRKAEEDEASAPAAASRSRSTQARRRRVRSRAMPPRSPRARARRLRPARRRWTPRGRGAGRRSRQRARLPRRRSVPSRRTSDEPTRPRTRAHRSRSRPRTRQPTQQGKRGCDQLDEEPRRAEIATASGTDGRGDYRAREVPGAERVGGEQDHDRVGAGGRRPKSTSPSCSPTRCAASHIRTGASHARRPDSVRAVGSAGERMPAPRRASASAPTDAAAIPGTGASKTSFGGASTRSTCAAVMAQ